MAVAGFRQGSHFCDGGNITPSIQLQAVNFVGGTGLGVGCGAAYEVDVVMYGNGTGTPNGLRQSEIGFAPLTKAAIVIINRCHINLVTDAVFILATHDDELLLRGNHGHVGQGHRHGIQRGPTGDTAFLLRCTIHGVYRVGAIVATHAEHIVLPCHHLVVHQGLGQVGRGLVVIHISHLRLK